MGLLIKPQDSPFLGLSDLLLPCWGAEWVVLGISSQQYLFIVIIVVIYMFAFCWNKQADGDDPLLTLKVDENKWVERDQISEFTILVEIWLRYKWFLDNNDFVVWFNFLVCIKTLFGDSMNALLNKNI